MSVNFLSHMENAFLRWLDEQPPRGADRRQAVWR
jgi:hypothetical protein